MAPTGDASHRPQRLQTTLSAAHKRRVVVALRETLLPPLDDLLAVIREPRSRARVWIVVCAATGFLTSRR